MLLMHFLNKVGSTIVDFASSMADFEVHVHFNTAMNPLELEIYHRIKDFIGMNRTLYEYVLVPIPRSILSLSLYWLISAYVLLNAPRP
jgi:hypothetical protein